MKGYKSFPENRWWSRSTTMSRVREGARGTQCWCFWSVMLRFVMKETWQLRFEHSFFGSRWKANLSSSPLYRGYQEVEWFHGRFAADLFRSLCIQTCVEAEWILGCYRELKWLFPNTRQSKDFGAEYGSSSSMLSCDRYWIFVVCATDRFGLSYFVGRDSGRQRLVGLGVWFSLWVREVPGSNPGRARIVAIHLSLQICWNAVLDRFFFSRNDVYTCVHR